MATTRCKRCGYSTGPVDYIEPRLREFLLAGGPKVTGVVSVRITNEGIGINAGIHLLPQAG